MRYTYISKRMLTLLAVVVSGFTLFQCSAADTVSEGVARVQQQADAAVERIENIDAVVTSLAEADSLREVFSDVISLRAFDALPGIDSIRERSEEILAQGLLSEEQQAELWEWHAEMSRYIRQFPALHGYVERFGQTLEQTIGTIEACENVIEEIDQTVGEVSDNLIERLNTQLNAAENLVDTMSSLVEVAALIPAMQPKVAVAASVLAVAKTGITLVRQLAKLNPNAVKATCNVIKVSLASVKLGLTTVREVSTHWVTSASVRLRNVDATLAAHSGVEARAARVPAPVAEPEVAPTPDVAV